ncbi:MAG: hypothetical protein P4M02_10100 [Clostridia bacterium]|nr:hypothetical protein [Clostridia bacterium]
MKRVEQVAKGFSFVLVTVVMVMMMVFGLLSLTSAGADMRLSQKASITQQVYYELDAKGEQLYAACAGAAGQAALSADAFMDGKLYNGALPDDFYTCLLPLVSKVKSAPNGDGYAPLKRGVFFYYLEKQLDNVKGDYNLSYKVDTDALSAAISTQNPAAPVAYVYSTIDSRLAENNSLGITLICDYGGTAAAPAFKTAAWKTAVSGLEISSSSKVNVWNGKN